MVKHLKIRALIFLLVLLSSCDRTKVAKPTTEDVIHSEDVMPSSIGNFSSPFGPTTITRGIKKDSHDNLLIASYEGIMRYDHSSGLFSNFTKQNGLDTCNAFDVLEDRKGHIWIASDNKGVFRWDGTFFQNFTTADGLAHMRNICLYEDTSGQIWIGGQGGLSCYDGISFQNFTTEEGLPHNDVSCIMEDSSGKIWIGTRGKACILEGKTFTILLNSENKPFNNVWSIIEDRNGNMWINGKEGLCRFDGDSFTYIETDGGLANEDRDGNIWSVWSAGNPPVYTLSKFTLESALSDKPVGTPLVSRPSSEGSADGMIFCVTQDKEGAIWFGTLFGVCKFDGQTTNCFEKTP